MTRYIRSPSLKARLVTHVLPRWQACSGMYKMAAMQEKSFYVPEYAKCSSVTSVQRAFLRKYGKVPAPGHQSIFLWFRQFRGTGCLRNGKSTGRVSEKAWSA
ncbi:hypothetical protein AVEN_13526-1 [Araneus ventricosus]|uniref:DUF4817 domain-containing protein n=1 Tax=Araneus ventricosus TaxID=182803 RepID=A0A4Y2SD53_ARAVE|nr:hypothetical protein AVEN_235047-1 [Araneus ventricosus]GBN85997.1 hypothetical protein AVEN_13526-1 [Araneus ventricosus]